MKGLRGRQMVGLLLFSVKDGVPIKVLPCGQWTLRVIMKDRFRHPVGHLTLHGRR
jgi:hypothetical protein